MQTIDWLALVMRWFHILAGMIAVGGMIFIRAVIVPSRDAIAPDQFTALHAAMRARWSKIVAASIAVLLVSGFVSFGINEIKYELPKWYHAVWGIKFLLALVMFGISSLLAGKTALADRLRQNIKFWLNLNILLAVIVVCLSGVLRFADHIPKNRANLTDAPLAIERPND